ncbi:23S rRNA (cytidine(2498)-2'-O)-methyltransferase RlmM [Aestuariibacter sp. AA17]|uniref:Ribosomal RNA large subunit methyltransferase M n=1 Tax=Fluctibacter corallii TaxID=2984329 RepID=A0ABT3ADD9_9ALTE|nr:23S rRNA (cytidine(2498)-2'-O)-methyltransferase RlmM [Aestuariibacter sp. AA17]MCV2886655.1 23S rRNA (cytidine(2498)-2'-O)-methyltransferase RlmM [Aestuariibacter sp. AA17]
MKNILCYCRAGFETDLANELQAQAAEHHIYGYTSFKKNTGYALFHCYQDADAEQLIQRLSITQLIFARQIFRASDAIDDIDSSDRIATLLEQVDDMPFCGELRVEYPDTTEGRELSKFCRKFSVPLRQALRKREVLSNKPLASKPVMHAFFPDGRTAYLGYSLPKLNSALPLGIMRLKFPASAPSRSTLKLDEAFQVFIPKEEHESRLSAGLHAVDLGACPGGWTYQLVSRGMFVQAVDNGKMDDALMETGQVNYFPEDGFKFTPKKKNVYWLVCDMIEQPQRVAKLMATWLARGWCKEAMFNLKLPMKRRYESVQEAFDIIAQVLNQADVKYTRQAKHLYHNREEVTVHLRRI